MRLVDVILAIIIFFITTFSFLLILLNSINVNVKNLETIGLKKLLENVKIEDCKISYENIYLKMKNFNEAYNVVEILPIKNNWDVNFFYRRPILLESPGNYTININFEFFHARNFTIILFENNKPIFFEAYCNYYNKEWIKECNITFSSNNTLVYIYYDVKRNNTLYYNRSLNLINISKNYTILPEEINLNKKIGITRGKERISIIRYINCYEPIRIACIDRNLSFCTKYFNETNLNELFNLSGNNSIYNFDAVIFFSNLSERILNEINETLLYDYFKEDGIVIVFYQNNYNFLYPFNIYKLNYNGYGKVLDENLMIINYPNILRNVFFNNSFKAFSKNDYKHYFIGFILDYDITNESLICLREDCWNISASPGVDLSIINGLIILSMRGKKNILLSQYFFFNESYFNNITLNLNYTIITTPNAELLIEVLLDENIIYRHYYICRFGGGCIDFYNTSTKYINLIKNRGWHNLSLFIFQFNGNTNMIINISLSSKYNPIGLILIENYRNGKLILYSSEENDEILENILHYIKRDEKKYILKAKIYYIK